MESRELDPNGFLVENRCDESKCVSQGGWNHFSDDTKEPLANFFTCYGDDGKFYPKMCADGFVPVTIEDEPTLSSLDWYGFENAGGILVSYFTCCPPALENPTATRRCLDPFVTPPSEDATCDEESSFKYPFPMKPNTLRINVFGPLATFIEAETGIDSYLCCDYVDTESSSADFLEDTECVPYRTEHYNGFFRENRIGSLFESVFPVSCDFPENSFSIPQPSSTTKFQCCKNGTPMPTYVHDSTFYVNVYTSLVLFGISAFLSFIVVTGLMIPLIRDLKNKKLRGGPSSKLMAGSTSSRSTRFSPTRGGEQSFSTYNVYLIYLMFLDLVWCMYGVIVRGLYINQVYVPNASATSTTMGIAYLAGNFWINAIILYEVFLLLKTSKIIQRKNPPSLTRLNLQGLAVYTVVVVYGLLVGLYFIPKGDLVIFYVVNFVMTGPPLFYVAGLPFWIWWYSYLPANTNLHDSVMRTSTGKRTVRDKAIRNMALYFFRVVFVFVILFFPVSIFMFIVKPWRIWPGYVNECILAIQPTVTFVFLLTKPDVKKYILDLVTLKVFSCDDNEPEVTAVCARNNYESRRVRTTLTSVLATGEAVSVGTQVAAPAVVWKPDATKDNRHGSDSDDPLPQP